MLIPVQEDWMSAFGAMHRIRGEFELATQRRTRTDGLALYPLRLGTDRTRRRLPIASIALLQGFRDKCLSEHTVRSAVAMSTHPSSVICACSPYIDDVQLVAYPSCQNRAISDGDGVRMFAAATALMSVITSVLSTDAHSSSAVHTGPRHRDKVCACLLGAEAGRRACAGLLAAKVFGWTRSGAHNHSVPRFGGLVVPARRLNQRERGLDVLTPYHRQGEFPRFRDALRRRKIPCSCCLCSEEGGASP